MLQEEMIKNYCDYVNIDFSPFLIIALNKAKYRENIPEVLIAMRRDYSELRNIGNRFHAQLEKAKTYKDISDCINDWNNCWGRLLKKIGDSDRPLFRRLFGWDVVKKGSLKGILINQLELLYKEYKNIQICKGLNIVSQIHTDFMYSIKLEKNIKRLFGGLVK